MEKDTEMLPLMCTCIQPPPEGTFVVEQDYFLEQEMGGVRVLDETGKVVQLSDEVFQACFNECADPLYPVTTDIPILQDETVYTLYLILEQGACELEAIRAYANLRNVNYVQAKRALKEGHNLLVAGTAFDMREWLHKLASFQVQYEIQPPYPYEF